MFTRRFVSGALLASVAVPSFAKSPYVFSGDTQFAINGYDPVAYFTQSDAVLGNSEFQSKHEDAIFAFATAEHKALFDANPEKYAPQYGGYCAYAVSKGYTASTDPQAWSVHNDKLYLNFSKSVRALWAARREHHISSGDANWPTVLDG